MNFIKKIMRQHLGLCRMVKHTHGSDWSAFSDNRREFISVIMSALRRSCRSGHICITSPHYDYHRHNVEMLNTATTASDLQLLLTADGSLISLALIFVT